MNSPPQIPSTFYFPESCLNFSLLPSCFLCRVGRGPVYFFTCHFLGGCFFGWYIYFFLKKKPPKKNKNASLFGWGFCPIQDDDSTTTLLSQVKQLQPPWRSSQKMRSQHPRIFLGERPAVMCAMVKSGVLLGINSSHL